MASKLGWIIVIVLVSNKISFASSLNVRVGNFQYLHRHPKLKSCADQVLKENVYVGGRVHMLTGECEGLNRSWVFNQTVQSEYAYAKKLSVQESFIPPLEKKNARTTWTIPGVLREGAIVAAEVEVPPGFHGLHIRFVGDDKMLPITLFVVQGFRAVTPFNFAEGVFDSPNYRGIECDPPQFTKEIKHKIAFEIHTGSLQLLVDDHEICMFTPTFLDPTVLSEIRISAFTGRIHGVEFIDA